VKYLLDTHVWLWLLGAPDKVAPSVRTQLEQADDLVLSAASVWEAAIKVQRGKLAFAARRCPRARRVFAAGRRAGTGDPFRICPRCSRAAADPPGPIRSSTARAGSNGAAPAGYGGRNDAALPDAASVGDLKSHTVSPWRSVGDRRPPLRIREAVSEIQNVRRKGPVLAAEGAVPFLEKVMLGRQLGLS
jgi:hypothetical protein